MHQPSCEELRAKDAITDLYNDDGPCIREKREALERLRDHILDCLSELD